MLVTTFVPARLALVRRIVVTEHTDEELRHSPEARKTASRYGRRVDAVSTVHSGIRKYIVGYLGFPEDQVVVIPNGVDTNRFKPSSGERNEGGWPSSVGDMQVIIGCVGRLHPDKDHMNLLKAARELVRRETTGFSLILVGDGTRRSDLERFVEENHLSDYVSFLGERIDVKDLYHTFDIFVLPSKTEGLPVALLEAMSSGLACIATSVGGVAEALENDSGLVVRPGDWKALAEALQQLIQDRSMRETLGARARNRVLAEFDSNRMFARYESLLLGYGGLRQG